MLGVWRLSPSASPILAALLPRRYRDAYTTGAACRPGARGTCRWMAPMVLSTALERGLAAFAEHRWGDAFDAMTESDAEVGLAADDLERLSTAALVLGREGVGLDLAMRAHEAFLELPDADGAARSATWIGL